MKKFKGLATSLMISVLLVGSLVVFWTDLNVQEGETTTLGLHTIQENPNPVRD
ncbi:hypothetical protein [Alkaliphilus transvaalensis]|uniref:hypothetical protein n=1 Tax=Alkaliphilus transvaalensis TaxID=114628 RepID=UPI0012EB7462|nr:hypothetical protein [Alkaliphilus transvaalensis]